MHKNQGHQRLNELFAGLELPAFNPAVETPEIRLEPESPPSPITDLEKPFLAYENGAFGIEAVPFADLQVQEQPSDELIVYETAQVEYAYSNDRLEALRESPSPLAGISNAIPSPFQAVTQTIGEMQSAPPPDSQLTDDDMSLMAWQGIRIGTLTGTLVTALVLASTSQMDIFNNLGRFALIVGEVLFGILGALSNLYSKKTRRAMWIGAMGWSLLPVFAALVLILFLTLILFTNFFGV